MFNPYKIRKEMKKAISILRIAILALMGSVGVLFLLGEEQDETVLSFSCISSSTRCFGLAMLAAMCVLFWRWCKTDNWLKAINEWCEEIDAQAGD